MANTWCSRCSCSPPCSAWWLDSTQIAGVARKKLQMTSYTIPNNIYFAKITLKSAPGAPDVEALPLAVPEHELIISGSYSLNSGKAGIPC